MEEDIFCGLGRSRYGRTRDRRATQLIGSEGR